MALVRCSTEGCAEVVVWAFPVFQRLCRTHRAQSDKARHRARSRAWEAVMRTRLRSVGVCVACGEDPGINPRTGKPFQRCFQHRAQEARYYQGSGRQQRRAERHRMGASA
jgi:hypothetical protein